MSEEYEGGIGHTEGYEYSGRNHIIEVRKRDKGGGDNHDDAGEEGSMPQVSGFVDSCKNFGEETIFGKGVLKPWLG